MNLTEQDLHELHAAHRDVFPPVVETARMRALLTDAAARSAVNGKLEQQRKHRDETQRRREQRELFMRDVVIPWSRELQADADRALLGTVLGGRNECIECGAREGERHSLTCSAWVASTAEQPEMMYQCPCGQTMLVKVWERYGCGRCGRRPVAPPGTLNVPRDDMGTEVPMLAEPEPTPAERTWRAHKGFTR